MIQMNKSYNPKTLETNYLYKIPLNLLELPETMDDWITAHVDTEFKFIYSEMSNSGKIERITLKFPDDLNIQLKDDDLFIEELSKQLKYHFNKFKDYIEQDQK